MHGTSPTVTSRAVMYGCSKLTTSRAFGPQRQTGVRSRDVVDVDRAVARHVPLEPGAVVRSERGAGDEQEAILGAAQHGEVGFDPAAAVEELRVDDAADGPVDPVRAQPLEKRERSRPKHLELRERRLVEERDPFAGGSGLHLDRRRPVLAGPAARPQRLVAALGVRLVPVHTLPAALLPEGCVEREMPLIDGRYAKRSPGLPLLARVLDAVVLRQRLVGARERVRAAAVLAAEAAPVERPHVPLGPSVDDPLAHA